MAGKCECGHQHMTRDEFMTQYDRHAAWRSLWGRLSNRKPKTWRGKLQVRDERVQARAMVANNRIKALMDQWDAQQECRPAPTDPPMEMVGHKAETLFINKPFIDKLKAQTLADPPSGEDAGMVEAAREWLHRTYTPDDGDPNDLLPINMPEAMANYAAAQTASLAARVEAERIPIETLSRIEVIGPDGRVGTWWDVTVKPMVQDEGRTLKLFIQDRAALAAADSGEK